MKALSGGLHEGTHVGGGAGGSIPSGQERTSPRRALPAGRCLGRGGMGTMCGGPRTERWAARSPSKELRFPSSIDDDEKRRLITRTLREAKAIARIRNNGAVTVFDVVDEDNRPWIVMELVEGKSLAEVIREDGGDAEARRRGGARDTRRAAFRAPRGHSAPRREAVERADLRRRPGRADRLRHRAGRGRPVDHLDRHAGGRPLEHLASGRAGTSPAPRPTCGRWAGCRTSLSRWPLRVQEGFRDRDAHLVVMTEPVEQPKNAGPLENGDDGLLKDPRSGSTTSAPGRCSARWSTPPSPGRPAGAGRTRRRSVVLPPVPDEGRAEEFGGSGGSGAKRGEEAGERLRGALRSVRKAASVAGAATAAATAAAMAVRSPAPRAGRAVRAARVVPAVPRLPVRWGAWRGWLRSLRRLPRLRRAWTCRSPPRLRRSPARSRPARARQGGGGLPEAGRA